MNFKTCINLLVISFLAMSVGCSKDSGDAKSQISPKPEEKASPEKVDDVVNSTDSKIIKVSDTKYYVLAEESKLSKSELKIITEFSNNSDCVFLEKLGKEASDLSSQILDLYIQIEKDKDKNKDAKASNTNEKSLVNAIMNLNSLKTELKNKRLALNSQNNEIGLRVASIMKINLHKNIEILKLANPLFEFFPYQGINFKISAVRNNMNYETQFYRNSEVNQTLNSLIEFSYSNFQMPQTDSETEIYLNLNKGMTCMMSKDQSFALAIEQVE